MKKIIAIVLTLAIIATMCACSGSSSTGSSDAGNNDQQVTATAQSDGTTGSTNDADGNGCYDYLKFALHGDPADLLPWNIKMICKEPIYYGIWECLYDFIDGEYVPRLAVGEPEVVDATHYDVTIYDYITDINGNNITADDVVKCYDRFIEAGYTQKFNAYSSVEKVDDYTVRFEWAYEPTGVRELERPLCYVPIYCFDEFDEAKFATDPITTGPYKVSDFIAGSGCTLTRRDDYWQTDESKCNAWQKATVDTIDFVVLTEASQNLIALRNNEIDVTSVLPDENWDEYLDGKDGHQTVMVDGTDFYIYIINQSEDNVGADENFRLACFYAIDNEEVAQSVYGRIASKSLGVASCPDYYDSFEFDNYINTYDEDKAKEYLEKSSYAGEELTLRCINSDEGTKLASIIQLYLEAIGVKTKIVSMDDATLVAEMNQDDVWDMTLMLCGGPFVIKGVNKFMNNNEYNGDFCLGFIKDDKLQTLFETANNNENWNEENMLALIKYDIEQAYHYAIYSKQSPVIVPTDCTDPCLLPDCAFLAYASEWNLD